MSKPDEGRRNFLIGAAAGGAAVAGAVLIREAVVQSRDANSTVAEEGHAHMPGGARLGAFFNAEDAATIEAFTERLMPGAPGKPGARDANVLNYIDLALAGAYADRQDFYRRGLAQLEAHCRAAYNESFARLSPAQQDETIAALESGKAAGFPWPSAEDFFELVRIHTMEGMFADPIYGGNKDFAGWRLVGFPGAQPTFSPQDLASREAFQGASVIGLATATPNPARRS
jgi:gluconate 2-dehydrogenase gamma chain